VILCLIRYNSYQKNSLKGKILVYLKYEYIKSILFLLEPEIAHKIAELFLRFISNCSILFTYFLNKNFVSNSMLKQEIFNKEFINPIGLAAGFDKNANIIKPIGALGFGFTEIGTITPLPQVGNSKPRLFRLIDEDSLQNAMGFNNLGVGYALGNLKKIYPFCLPIGVNIGKNKDTIQKDSILDYQFLVRSVESYADYLTINLSSPNTPNLRDLQNEKFIKKLLTTINKITTKPILIKISPDMSVSNALLISNSAIEHGASGIIIANTSIDYSLSKNAKDFGGLSGELIRDKSYKFFLSIAKELFGKTILISVGGINSSDEAYRRLKAGASLIQIYSSLIFKGPSIIGDINRDIIKLLKIDGYKHISEAIGIDLK
jgi:dihydroorotate dehydrogenase